MIPVTTPTFIIHIKDGASYLQDTTSIRVDIRQQDVLLKKYQEDLIIDAENSTVAVTLTQKESAKFLYKKGDLEFQIHGLLSDGTAWKTFVVETPVKKTLSKEVIS